MKLHSTAAVLSIILSAVHLCGAQDIQTQVLDTGEVRFIGKSDFQVFDAIVVLENNIVVADHEGVLHGFTLQENKPAVLNVDTSFGENGRIDLPARVLQMNRLGKNKIILKTYKDVFLVSDGQLKKATVDIPLVSNGSSTKGITSDGTKTYFYKLNPQSGHYEKSLWIEHDNQDQYPSKHQYYRIESVTLKDGKIFFGDNYIDKAANRYQWGGVRCVDLETREVLFNITTTNTESDSYFGCALDLEPTASGVTIIDTNMRTLTLISPEGEILKKIKEMDFSDLFGSGYLWTVDSSSDSEGNLYVIAASRRDDEEAAEGFIYRISGL